MNVKVTELEKAEDIVQQSHEGQSLVSLGPPTEASVNGAERGRGLEFLTKGPGEDRVWMETQLGPALYALLASCFCRHQFSPL